MNEETLKHEIITANFKNFSVILSQTSRVRVENTSIKWLNFAIGLRLSQKDLIKSTHKLKDQESDALGL